MFDGVEVLCVVEVSFLDVILMDVWMLGVDGFIVMRCLCVWVDVLVDMFVFVLMVDVFYLEGEGEESLFDCFFL